MGEGTKEKAEKGQESMECCVYHNPIATGVFQDLAHLPRCYLQAAAKTGSVFIAQKQTHPPTSLLLPELETSKRKHIWILSILHLWPAGGARQVQEKHLLQGRM